MKVNLDLTAAASANLIIDELHTDVGSSAFDLDHDFFYGGVDLDIWTAAGQTGTQLVEDTDYTLGDVNANLTSRAGRNVYTTVTVTNATYQTGDLYFTYQATADYVDATDRYRVERADGQYYDLTSTGTFEIATTDTGASSVDVNSAGGVNVTAANDTLITTTNFTVDGVSHFKDTKGTVYLSQFATFQAALDYLNTTYSGGTLFVDVDNYDLGAEITAAGQAIQLYSDIVIQGFKGRNTSILSADVNYRHFVGVDVSYVSFRDIRLVGPGIGAANGGGVSLTRSVSSDIDNIMFDNVVVEDIAQDAIVIQTPVSCEFRGVNAVSVAGHGFNLYGNGHGNIFINCYALTGYGSGFYLENIGHTTIAGCMGEAFGASFEINGGNTITFVSSSARGPVDRTAQTGDPGYGFKLNGASIKLTASRVLGAPSTAILVQASGTNITLDSVLTTGTTGTYSLDTSGGGSVTIIESNLDATLNLNTDTTFIESGDIESSGDLTLNDQYLTSAIPLSQTGTAGLSGLTATSIIGAINEVAAYSLDDVYGNGSSVTVDSADVNWNLGSTLQFRVYDATDADKFVVTQGTGASSVSINTTGGIDFDSASSITISSNYASTTTGLNLTLETTNTSTGTGGNVVLQTTAASGTAGDIVISSASAGQITTASGITIQDTSSGTAKFSLSETLAGQAIITATDTGASAVDINSSGGVDIDGAGAIALTTSGGDISFDDQYLTAAVPVSESGTSALAAAFTATSIVGALNELSGYSLDTVYGNGSTITVDATDVNWNLGSALDFRVYDATDADKFVVTQGNASNSIIMNTSGGIDVDTLNGVTITDTYTATGTGIGITLTTANTSTGTGGDIVIQTTAASGTAGGIDLSTDSTVRIGIANTGDTIFYGTASTTGALPVITLDQADVDEPFFKIIGDAASATLTNNIVSAADTGGGTTVAGYLKIEVQDDGNQVADGDYYVAFYTLA